MARTKRTHPIMASDIRRSLLLLLLTAPIGLFIDEAFLVLFPALDNETLGEASSNLGWAAFALTWAIWTLVLFGRQDSATMHRWLAETTPPPGWRRVVWGLFGGGGTYWAVVGSTAAILGLIGIGTQREDSVSRPLLIVVGVILVICSLLLTIVAFAVRYAREVAQHGGLSFPGTDEPRLSDYIYFSTHLTISLGGADVVVESNTLRRLVTTHSIVAYAYNAIVLGLLVSVLLEALA